MKIIRHKLANLVTASSITAGLLVSTQPAFANSVQGAVVTRTEGEAQLMIKKSAGMAAPAGASSVLFEKETYFVRPVKNGDRPANGDVVTTGKTGKVRLIYRNGDQVTVTPGTAYKFSWDAKTDKNAIAEVVYGDIRAVIQPEGPRAGMKVQTKSAVMGVRGTDFYVSAWSKDAGSKVAVMRGKVAVAAKPPEVVLPPTDPKDKKAPEAAPAVKPVEVPLKEIEVGAGSSGVVKQIEIPKVDPKTGKAEAPAAPAIQVASTSQQELVVIQQDSKVVKPKVDPAAKNNDPVTQELEKLEETSVQTTLQDVKKYDPALYTKLVEENKKGKSMDADQIQAETVKKIFVTAPSEKVEARKPTLNDLETGGDIYDKYKWEKK